MKDYALNTGTVLHGSNYDYTIERVLGNGTFGITYLAKVKMKGSLGSLDTKLNVAIKEFFMRDFNGREESSVTYISKDGAFTYYKSKFIHEAENLSKLHSSGIVKVLELFEANQTAYYVMDYLPKGSLDEYIKTKKLLPLKICVDYAIQISEALKYMHDNQMLHLDLKPGNIMIDEHDRLVLIDFGLSKRFDQWGNPETSTTIGHGTPGYAPVEQAHYQGYGNEGLPVSMDIYALGATIFKMLTGHRPPEASIILNEPFPVQELKKVGTPDALINVVRTCMEPLRKNRYQSIDSVIEALMSLPKFAEDEEGAVTEKKENGEKKNFLYKDKYGRLFKYLINIRVRTILAVLLGFCIAGGMVYSVIMVIPKTTKTIFSKINSYYYSKTYTVNGISFDMIYVQGSHIKESPSEKNNYNSKDVWINSFLIGKTEVTQELWKAVMGSDISQIASKYNRKTYGIGNDYPMYYVSWNDCQAFISKLNSLTGMYFRMPSELEWKYAAVGGILCGDNSYKWGCGTSLADLAWYSKNNQGKAQPVAKKQPNELGVYDLFGNVWEWSSNTYNYRDFLIDDDGNTFDAISDKSQKTKHSERYYACCGGAWNDNLDLKITRESSDSCRYNIGLRLCISLDENNVPCNRENSVQINEK